MSIIKISTFKFNPQSIAN